MKENTYIKKLIEKLAGGEKLTKAEQILTKAYQAPAYTKYGFICVDVALHNMADAAALARQRSDADINELYITGEWSNQFDSWLAMGDFGLKLRGILQIPNAEYDREIEKWGESDRPQLIPALKFSFN